MKSFSRNFIIFYLIVCILGAFAFHWFFVDDMMPANDCFSTDCAYSSTQTIPQETQNVLLIALLAILLLSILPPTILLDDKSTELLPQVFLKWKINGFCRKFISWFKILEKRDPHTTFIAVRISDFRQ